MKRAYGVVVVVLLGVANTFTQSTEQAVQRVNAALLEAAGAGDKAAYSKLAADDLRWVQSDGSVLTKSQRVALLTGRRTVGRIFRDTDVKVYGTTAVLLCRSDWTANGRKMSERVQRVFVNRGGQWLLVSHSTTPMDPAK